MYALVYHETARLLSNAPEPRDPDLFRERLSRPCPNKVLVAIECRNGASLEGTEESDNVCSVNSVLSLDKKRWWCAHCYQVQVHQFICTKSATDISHAVSVQGAANHGNKSRHFPNDMNMDKFDERHVRKGRDVEVRR